MHYTALKIHGRIQAGMDVYQHRVLICLGKRAFFFINQLYLIHYTISLIMHIYIYQVKFQQLTRDLLFYCYGKPLKIKLIYH